MNRKLPHSISDHDGILDVAPLADGSQIAIEFDPARLDEVAVTKKAEDSTLCRSLSASSVTREAQ